MIVSLYFEHKSADRHIMENVVLAGPNGVIPDSSDPYCHQECQPSTVSGEYDLDACMICYKNETLLAEMRDKFELAGGSYRTEPSIPQIMNCLDTYLPTLLTSEEPFMNQTMINGTNVSGYISGNF